MQAHEDIFQFFVQILSKNFTYTKNTCCKNFFFFFLVKLSRIYNNISEHSQK